MPKYNYNGVDFSEEEVLSKAKEKGLDIDTYINKFGIKRIEDTSAIEPPGKPKPAVKKGAVTAGKPKSTASKLVKPSSASQDNIFGEDKIKSSFLGKLQEAVAPDAKTIKPVSVKTPKSTIIPISEYQAKEKKKEEGSFLNYIKESLDNSISTVTQSIYKAPEYAYDLLASNVTDPLANTLREAAGLRPVHSSSDQIMETFGIRNIPAETLQKRINESNKIIKAYSDKNGVDPLTAIENGNYLGAAKLVAGGTAQSFAPMAAAMLSGGSSTALAGIAASTAVSKSEELKVENPEMDTQTRVNNAAVSGLLEGYLGQLFTGASGAVVKRIITDKGAKAGSKILSNGLMNTLETAIEKNPLIAVVGEVAEEGGVELGDQLNDINSGIRKELDYRKIANAGIIALGMAGTNTVPVYAAKGYMKATEYNKVKAVNKEINNLTEQLSNPFVSNSDKKIISSRVTRLVDENKAIVGSNMEKINALPDVIKKEIAVLNDGLDNIRSKYIDIKDNYELPEYVQKSMVQELELQAKDLQKRKSSIIEGNYIYEDFKKLPEAEQIRFKDKATEMSIADSELIGENKTSFNEEEINKDAVNLYNAELRTQKIITDVERTQQAIKNIGLGEELDMPELNTANDVIKYLTENTTLDADTIDNVADNYGSFIPLANGKEALLINKEAAEIDQVVTTGQHEFLHKLIYKAVLNDPKLQKQMGVQLYNHIENYIGTDALNDTKFKGRYDTYKAEFEDTKSGYETTIAKAKAFLDKEQITQEQYDKTTTDANNRIAQAEGKYLEEVLPLLSESLSSGDVKYNETFFTKIGDIIRRVFQKYGLSKVRFDTGKDVFNFVRDYNKSFEKGQFNKAFKALAKEGSYKGSVAKGNKAVRTIPTAADIKSSKAQVESLTKELQDLEDEYDEGYGDMEEAEYTAKKSNIERKIKVAEKLIEKAPIEEEKTKKESKLSNVYHGGDIIELKSINDNIPFFVTEDDAEAIAYSKGNEGDVFIAKIDMSKIADEEVAIKILEDMGYPDEYMLHERIDPRFEESYIGEKNVKKLSSEIEKQNYEGVKFNDSGIANKKNVTNIFLTSPKKTLADSGFETNRIAGERKALELLEKGYKPIVNGKILNDTTEEDLYQLFETNDYIEMSKPVTKKAETKQLEIDQEENALKKIIREEKASISSDKVQKIYNEKGRNGADEIIKLFRPITKRIVDKRRDAPDFDRELLTDEIETGVGGILDLITKYKPESGVPLAAYINKYLPVRAIATSKRILGKQFSKDVSEEVGIMATETADQNMIARAAEKPTYKNALESKVFEPEALETINNKIITVIRTLKSRIDAPITLNRTVTPLIAEIRDEIGKQVDIDVKTAMGGKKDNQLKNWLLKNKKYILENMTTTWLMGKDGQGGMPIAIQKQIDGKWTNFPEWVGKKIDRESVGTDNAGRTSGRELARRLPNVNNNISEADFLDQVLGPDGNPLRGRKESLAKAIAEEASFDIILDDLSNEGPIFDAIKANQQRQGVEVFETLSAEIARQAERGNVKQSKKVAKEVLTVLSKNEWDLDNEDYKKFVSNLSKEDSDYVTNVLQEKSIKQLRKYLKVIDLENKEFDFKNKIISALEDPVEKVLSKINRFKLISKVASTSTSKLTDLKIEYKKNTYNFELKLDKDSRLKGVVINNVTTNPTINKDTGINDVIADALKNDSNVKAYTDYLLANGGEIVANGSIKVPINVFKDPKARDLQDKAKVTIKANADLVKKLNNNTNDAITFGGVGTFSYGDTKFEGILPDLEGDVNFEIGTQRGSMDKDKNVSVYFIGFPRMAPNWDQKSTVDIHDKPKKLLTIIRKAALLKRNRISAKAIKTVLSASRPSYAAKPKKINVIDIDERLGKIKKKVSYKDKDGKAKKLTIPEFLKQQIQLELDGIIFDYTDVKAEVAKNKDILEGFDNTNPDDSFAITTEPTESNNAIQVLLQNVGVNIPANNINTLDENTAEAKANWVTGKLSEGFNDFNIAGDKFKNSNGVKTILEDFDIKGEKQQKKLAFFNSLDGQFNKIISQNTGIGPMITYSDIVAKRRGANKGIFDVYVPPSAADFELLLYKFLGKGTKGEEQYKFFRDALLDPYSNGTDLLDAARQSIKNDYKQLLKDYPFVKGQLEKLIPNSEFTYDQAIRVAIWDANGVEIPGLTKKDQRMLSNFVNNDPDLTAFKKGLLITGKQGKDWIKPEANWDSSTIISDLHGLTEGNGRKKFLEEFIANYEQIFGKWEQGRLVGPNMNKVEALYGTDTREAIEDVLYRMTTGKNRSQSKDKATTAWTNWVNGSTGAIMFLNIRSASLQLLGAVNFLNLRDNNPAAAGKAFLNPKQYWEDFATIWNSDKMKERRGGLKEDVAASEIANAAAGSKNKPAAVISWLLKKGYAPTQLADSFAIASGGAPFYRNRINSYLKEGLTQEEAEDKAWTDFTKVSDETQQSGDPRDISQQQASPAGRLLLTFQNTAMQQSRIVKKSFLDLKNGRGNAKTHVSKIIYYLAIQNILFSTLQQGLFAVIFDDDKEEEKYTEEDKKSKPKTTEDRIIDVANGVLDSILRGTGYYGAIVATLKNMAVKYLDEKDKDYKADYAKVVLEGANISPPIGSKARKIYSALQQTKFEKDLIEKRGWGVMQDGRVHLGPMYSVVAKPTEALTNIPVERFVNKVENVSQAMNSQNEAWQRVALTLGWNSISLGIEETPGDIKIREEAKAVRKEASLIKGKETRERKKDSIKALPLNERIAIKKAAALERRAKAIKRREDAKKSREEKKKRKMG
jgi:hypothetical protein